MRRLAAKIGVHDRSVRTEREGLQEGYRLIDACRWTQDAMAEILDHRFKIHGDQGFVLDKEQQKALTVAHP